jgi:hypothetical protein
MDTSLSSSRSFIIIVFVIYCNFYYIFQIYGYGTSIGFFGSLGEERIGHISFTVILSHIVSEV